MIKRIINEENKNKVYFFGLVLLAYLFLFFYNRNLFFKSLINLGKLILKLIPAFLLVFVLMFLVDLFLDQKKINKHFKEKGIKKWIFTIIAGIISSGPIYMWYPLLAQLRKKGVSYGLIACFLYNRAVKLPLLPIFIYYFDLKFVSILTFTTVLASVLQGVIVEKIVSE